MSHNADRTRRAWSGREELFLMGIMKELVAYSWKFDNGFRSGYQMKAEEAMRREFPGTDLKVNPHIQSRIHTWKKSFYALSKILDRSGVGFNVHGDYKIDVSDDQWSEIVKADGAVRSLRNKSWPYYEDWKIIFGKDRANGTGAEDMLDAYNDLEPIEHVETTGAGLDFDFGLHAFLGGDAGLHRDSPTVMSDSGFSRARESPTTETSSKKRKTRDAGLEGLVEVIGKMHEATNVRLEYLGNIIGYEFDLTKAHKDVFELVSNINGIILAEVFDASDFILEKVERMDFFMSLPEVARHAYVFRALGKYGAK
ncbi:hypothetical protein SASPL_145322 [Salvia splendens]|uniref:Myb/SANT-like domain-containing protein n=1 Tax=Salvia splendens TaxID=180675 RepID=A0A8X8WGW1_SALSN|nr:hypothetical protein SASPL_145322 [Salvia splendens]